MDSTADHRTADSHTAMRSMSIAAGIVGVAFLLVGILGFVPGVTTDLDGIEFVGHESNTELLGIFRVNILHNIVHLAFGVVGLAVMRSSMLARNYLTIGGVIYLVLWAYGLSIDLDSEWNFVSLNTADNWLHFGLGAGMILLGLVGPGRRGAAGRAGSGR